MLGALNDDAELLLQQRVAREAEWRRSLDVGDYIDAISHY